MDASKKVHKVIEPLDKSSRWALYEVYLEGMEEIK